MHLRSTLVAAAVLVALSPVAPAEPQAPAPPPAWTKAKSVPIEGARKVKFTMKFVEIAREEENANPAMRYRKTLEPAAFEESLRELSQKKGVDLMTAPSVVAWEGKVARTHVGRELVIEAPGAEEGLEKLTVFLGVRSHVRALPAAGGGKLTVDVAAEVSEIQGHAAVDGAGLQPIISNRQLEGRAEVAPGETLVIGGLVTRDEQTIEDKVPVLGDVPLVGGLFRSSETITVFRELIVMVTPTVVE